MTEIASYRDLRVWQRAMDLAEQVYAFTRPFPAAELYGLTSQARRAAVSIAANIAEGCGRDTTPVYINFLRISQGSLKELETHLLLAERLQFSGGSDAVLSTCEELGRMLRTLIRTLEQKL